MHNSSYFNCFFAACSIGVLLFFSCSQGRLGGEWSIPREQLAEGEGNGDIPAINNPIFQQASEVDFLGDSSIVLGVSINGKIRAYPLQILSWHEVVNDEIDSIPIAITYSALSGSSIVFDRRVRNNTLQFRVSGLLYNSNTILNEFETFTDWSQLLRKGVRGDLIETPLSSFPVVEMRWEKWRQLFPNSEVLTRNTGFNRPYGTYPYGDYRTDSTNILFDLPLDIDSLNQVYFLKEKMLGVKVGNVVQGFRESHFATDDFSIIETEVGGVPILVIGQQGTQLMVAYGRQNSQGEILQFSITTENNQVILTDNQGSLWSIFGQSLTNPTEHLVYLESNVAYWFTWATFYPEINIFQ
ncbi:MAG: DUF3179 domain-containing protein [Bacteroidota bacterium]